MHLGAEFTHLSLWEVSCLSSHANGDGAREVPASGGSLTVLISSAAAPWMLAHAAVFTFETESTSL